MESYIAYISNNYDVFDPVLFYKHFDFLDENIGQAVLKKTLNTICWFENESPVRRWAITQKDISNDFKHFATIETKKHWAEISVSRAMADRLTAAESNASFVYRRVAATHDQGESSANNNNNKSKGKRCRRNKRKYAASDGGSKSSQDDKPRRKLRIHTEVNNDEEEETDERVNDDEKWMIGTKSKYPLSDYLFEYRSCSVDCNNKKYKQLTMARMMAIHHIFYFPKDAQKSCIRDLECSHIDFVYQELPYEYEDPIVKASSVNNYVEKVVHLLNKPKIDEAEKLRTFGKIMIEAADSGNQISMKIAEVLFDLARYFINKKNDSRKTRGEDTFVHQIIAPFIRNIFQGEDFGSKCFSMNQKLQTTMSVQKANAQLTSCTKSPSSPTTPNSTSISDYSDNANEPSSSSMTNASKKQICRPLKRYLPDFTSYIDTHGEKFDVVALEVKPPESSLGYDDMPKIGLELQKMLNVLVDNGCEEPVVCGVLIDGFKCTTVTMDIKYDGIYRLIEQDTFTLPMSSEDLYKIKYVVSSFMKLKKIADKTKTNVINKMKSRGNRQVKVDPMAVPKKHWKRKCYEQVKQQKKMKEVCKE